MRNAIPGKDLKQCGAPPASLAEVYTTVVRPALEYAAPVWQNIPDFPSYKIESIQKRAMRIYLQWSNKRTRSNNTTWEARQSLPGLYR